MAEMVNERAMVKEKAASSECTLGSAATHSATACSVRGFPWYTLILINIKTINKIKIVNLFKRIN